MPVVVISSEVVFGSPLIERPDAVPAVTIIEFDAPRCQLTYGVAPCTAALGVTGDRKCFNTRATCQDRPNFDGALVTFRFTRPSARIHRDGFGDVVPSVRVVRTTPQLLNPGRDLGQRESVSVTFDDHPHSDAGLDPYLADRDYNPFEQGTFWGKFRARYPSLRGLPLRVYRGELGDALEDMETWHYVIETAVLSGSTFSITAKDHLKLLDGDRAQAPRVSRGQLAAGIAAGDGSLTLEPAGIGDIDYPASGRAAIGGKEIVDFTRSGDAVTLDARGVSNTTASDHEAGDRFQLVLQYTSEPVEAIVYDLLTQYTETDPAWINFPEWEDEVGDVVAQLYSAEIAEPTDVRKLVNELIEQVGLIIWWDPKAMRVRLTALRPVLPTERVIDAETMMRGTFRATEQPNKRISEVWSYFNLRNPLERLDDPANFQSVAVSFDSTADPEEPPAIHKVFSRWIGFGNRAAALRLNGLLLSRYAQPPRRFAYELFRGSPMPELGRGSRIAHHSLQDDTGAAIIRPVQVVAAEVDFDRTRFEVEEMLFAANDDLGNVRLIVIDTDAFNVNLRTVHDSFYGEPGEYDEVVCLIDSSATVGSTNPALPAFDVGDWPPLVTITLQIRGDIRGAGGAGGAGQLGFGFGQDGGVGLYTRYAVTIDSAGVIAGGGGGGGGGHQADIDSIYPGGGGGAGVNPGAGGPYYLPGAAGTRDAGGAGGVMPGAPFLFGGDGGAPGAAGTNGSGFGTGGAAGPAVDGDSFVTYANPGTIMGPQIN